MLLALDVGNTNIVIGFLDESGIRNIARLGSDGMLETDQEILRIMTQQ